MSYQTTHEDIVIQSAYPVTVRTRRKTDYEETVAPFEDRYQDWRMTHLLFQIQSSEVQQSVKMTVDLKHKIEPSKQTKASFFRYNVYEEEWHPVSSFLYQDEQILEGTTDRVGIYGIFINLFSYEEEETRYLAEEYPSWTDIQRRDDDGHALLNTIGYLADQIKQDLSHMEKQRYLVSADTDMLDWIYQYPTPNIKSSYTIEAYEGEREVPVLETLHEFFYNDRRDGIIFDYDKSRAYSVKKYENLRIQYIREVDGQAFFESLPAERHLIWNVFDEFGLVLGLKRRFLETNAHYKERLLDVFRYPSNTTKTGFHHGLARELSLIGGGFQEKEITWEDDRKDLVIEYESRFLIDPATIQIDDAFLPKGEAKQLPTGDIFIEKQQTGRKRKVRFIQGLKLHAFHDEKDYELQNLKYDEDNRPTKRFESWVKDLNRISPVLWDHFRWDEGFWDPINKKEESIAFLPNQFDQDMTGWKHEKVNQKKWKEGKLWETIFKPINNM